MRFIITIITLLFITACSVVKVYDEINLRDFNNMIDKKNDFILVVGSDSQDSQKFKLTLNRIIDKYNLDIKYLNLSKLSNKDRGLFIRRFSISKMPVTLFFNDGLEKKTYNRITGNIKYSKVIERFKENNYIKG